MRILLFRKASIQRSIQWNKRGTATCSKCNKRGHLAKACRNPEKVDRPKQKDGNAVSSYSECFISPLQESNNPEVSSHLIVDTAWLLGSHSEPEGIIHERTHSW